MDDLYEDWRLPGKRNLYDYVLEEHGLEESLSQLPPQKRRRSNDPPPQTSDAFPSDERRSKPDYDRARPSKFRFKSSHTKSTKRRSNHDRGAFEPEPTGSGRSHMKEKESSKHKKSRKKEKSMPPPSPEPDPDAAFRESLFDALADDEGAEYWEGVYGQPIHVYPRTKVSEEGSLEAMTDEEYAEYVRARMWEKTHQHVVEERQRREKARQREREQKQYAQEEQRRWRDRHEQAAERASCLARLSGSDVAEREWTEAGTRYADKWLRLVQNSGDSALTARAIPWPVRSGREKDISKSAVEAFVRRCFPADELTALLKAERVRWHPDKMQQRFRGALDERALRSVTAVFQIVDNMWADMKKA